MLFVLETGDDTETENVTPRELRFLTALDGI